MLETVIIVASCVGLSLFVAWASQKTGLRAYLVRTVERAAVDSVLGKPDKQKKR